MKNILIQNILFFKLSQTVTVPTEQKKIRFAGKKYHSIPFPPTSPLIAYNFMEIFCHLYRDTQYDYEAKEINAQYSVFGLMLRVAFRQCSINHYVRQTISMKKTKINCLIDFVSSTGCYYYT